MALYTCVNYEVKDCTVKLLVYLVAFMLMVRVNYCILVLCSCKWMSFQYLMLC